VTGPPIPVTATVDTNVPGATAAFPRFEIVTSLILAQTNSSWWADLISEPQDDLIGSRHWILERIGKVDTDTAVEFESVFREAFEWMLEDGIAARVVVSAERTSIDRIEGSVQIFKPTGDNIPFKFIWDGQRLKLLAN